MIFDRCFRWLLRHVFIAALRRDWDELELNAYTHQAIREARAHVHILDHQEEP